MKKKNFTVRSRTRKMLYKKYDYNKCYVYQQRGGGGKDEIFIRARVHRILLYLQVLIRVLYYNQKL